MNKLQEEFNNQEFIRGKMFLPDKLQTMYHSFLEHKCEEYKIRIDYLTEQLKDENMDLKGRKK